MNATKIFISRPDGNKIPAIKYLPAGIDLTKQHPVVIYLHGRGDEGDGTEAGLMKLYNSTNQANLVKFAEERKFIVVAPQFVPAFNNWIPDGAGGKYDDDVVEWVKSNLPVDTARIYMTGISGGGGSIWDYLKSDPSRAKKIAAALIICGTQAGGESSYIASANLPLWAFHAADDSPPVEAKCTINQVAAVNSLNPAVPAKMTIFPIGGHAIWPRVYNDPAVYDWILVQKRGNIPPPEPTKSIKAQWEITMYNDGSVENKQLK